MTSENKSTFPALAAIVLVAAALRVWGIGFGLPDLFHQDEPIVVNHALAIGAGGWNPHFFVLPPFCLYFIFLVYAVGYLALKIVGVIADPSAYATLFLRDPGAFYLAARLLLGAAFGTATVWLVWKKATRLYTAGTGLCAALFLAWLPLHVRHSHYAYTDVAVTFALTLFWFELLRLARGEGGREAYARAGAALGWAVSVKYTAAYVAPVFMIALFFREDRNILSRRALTGAAIFAMVSLGVFAMIAPYTFLDWKEFLTQIHRQSGAEASLPFAHHLVYSLVGGAGPAFLVLATAGWAAMWVRDRRDAWITAAFALLFYTVNSIFGQPYARYVLPLVPLLCVAAAVGWQSFFGSRRLPMSLLAIGLVLFFFVPVTWRSNVLFSRPDTRTLCREWFEEKAPGSRLVLSSWTYGPRLARTAEQIRQMAAPDELRKERKRLELEIAEERAGYTVFPLSDSTQPTLQSDAETVRTTNFDYLVIDRLELSLTGEKLLKDMAGELEWIKTFSPYRDPARKKSVDPYDSTAAPDAPAEIFARDRLGPSLEVYRHKKEARA